MKRIDELEAKLTKYENKQPERAQSVDNDRGDNQKVEVGKVGTKLRPIDIKDVKRPMEYDGKATNFVVWYERLKDLLVNRHESWGIILLELEKRKHLQIQKPLDDIFEPPGG